LTPDPPDYKVRRSILVCLRLAQKNIRMACRSSN